MKDTKDRGQAVLLIAGYRHSGRSLVLQHLEQAGYRCVDNLPPAMVENYLSLADRGRKQSGYRGIALALDIADEHDVKFLPEVPDRIRRAGKSVYFVFIEAGDSTLEERSSATPQTERDRERMLLQPLAATADLRVDTSFAAPVEIRDRIIALVEGESRRVETVVEISSFGFKYGAMTGDLVLDVRFIPNPYYVARLRHTTGLEAECSDYVFSDPGACQALDSLAGLGAAMAPAFSTQGRGRLRIRIGCTGGRHRSVAMVEALGARLTEAGFRIEISHRDISRH